MKEKETQAQKAYFDLMVSSKTPFIRQDVINRLEDQLKAEGNTSEIISVASVSDRFSATIDNTPETTGSYKIYFLGKIKNPEINYEGYMKTSAYINYQMIQSIKWGPNTFNPGGILGYIFAWVFGFIIRFPIGLILSLIQLIVVSTAERKLKNSLN